MFWQVGQGIDKLDENAGIRQAAARQEGAMFIAGDTSYNQQLLIEGKVDGVSPNEAVARQTLAQISALAKERPIVYLPSHDPESQNRLLNYSILKMA